MAMNDKNFGVKWHCSECVHVFHIFISLVLLSLRSYARSYAFCSSFFYGRLLLIKNCARRAKIKTFQVKKNVCCMSFVTRAWNVRAFPFVVNVCGGIRLSLK